MTLDELKQWAKELIQLFISAHEEIIREGLLRDDLWDRLASPLEQVKEKYLMKRDVKNFPSAISVFNSVLNDLLLTEKSFIACPIW